MSIPGVDSLRVFEYPFQFYEACANEPRTSKWRTSEDGSMGVSWYGTSSYEDAQKLATEGWPEGMRIVEPLVNRISGELINSLLRPQIVFDVEGDMFDMGKVVEDEPECWMKWETAEGPSTTGPVHIVLNNAASAGVEKKQIERRGSAIMALALVLESAGRPCRVDVVTAVAEVSHLEFLVRLKDFCDSPQLDAMAYGLVNASFFRRHGFRMLEILGVKYSSYGQPTSPKFAPRGDVFLDCAHLDAGVWESDDSAMKWVIETLGKNGVQFK